MQHNYMLMNAALKGEAKTLDPTGVRDLRPEALGPDGRIQVLPASFWQATTATERALFGARTGLYSFPTVELVSRLQEIIAGRTAIEIGAGHGVLAEAMGIPGTDSFMQRMPQYRAMYEQSRMPIVPYGKMVAEMHASRAVRYYKPQVVIGCWVTWKFDPKQPDRGGNEVGIDEPDILRNCETYVMVGHERIHHGSTIWGRKPELEYPSFLFSRAQEGPGRDFLAIVKGLRK